MREERCCRWLKILYNGPEKTTQWILSLEKHDGEFNELQLDGTLYSGCLRKEKAANWPPFQHYFQLRISV